MRASNPPIVDGMRKPGNNYAGAVQLASVFSLLKNVFSPPVLEIIIQAD
jgi:hypothetical protein